MDSTQIIQLAIGLYLAFMGTVMSTKNLVSAVFFKFIPIVGAFALGLITFKVI